MTEPLLPLINDEKTWGELQGVGLQERRESYNKMLYDINIINSSGVPSLLAHPFIFSKRLEDRNKTAIDQFNILVKGLFTGIIKLKKIDLKNLGSLGSVIKRFQSDKHDSFSVLYWRKNPVGGVHPKCLVFPRNGIKHAFLEEIDKEIDIEIERLEKRNIQRGLEEIRFYFKKWTDEVGEIFENERRITENSYDKPEWLKQLLNMGNKWLGSEIEVYDALVKKNALKLEDNSLPLEQVKLEKNDRDEIIDITLVRYMDNIKCSNTNDGTSVNVSAIDKDLKLGADCRIECRADGKNMCPNCSGDDNKRPVIEQESFFELSSGKFIIWKDFAECSRPHGCNEITIVDNGEKRHAILSFGKLKIRVDGQILTKNDIFCEKIVKFKNTGKKEPDLPIKSAFLDFIDKPNNDSFKFHNGGNEYKIKLKGIREVINHIAQYDEYDAASILLFPDFRTREWSINYAFLFLPPEIGRASIKLFNVNNKELGVLKSPNAIKTDEPVSHIEMLISDKPMGIFLDSRELIEDSLPQACSMSIDFGTSNTIVAIKDDQGGGVVNFNAFKLEDKSYDLLRYDMVHKALIRNNTYWLPSYMPEGTLISTPSEIIFRDKNEKNKLESLNRPIYSFTIPNPDYTRHDADETVIMNFKWSGKRPFDIESRRTKLVKAYLKMVLHIVLAGCRSNNYSKIKLVATSPLAFGKNKTEKYKNLLFEEIVKEVMDETGLVIDSFTGRNGAIRLLSESEAGKARCNSVGNEIVVDIGGGTTDIALFRNGEILAMDSTEYGGKDFIHANADLLFKGLETSFADSGFQFNKDQKEILITKAIRTDGIMNGIIGQMNLQPGDNDYLNINNKISFFFEGIFDYLEKFLVGYNIKEITLYPLGNCWNFLDFYAGNPDDKQDKIDTIVKFIEKNIKPNDIKVNVDVKALEHGKEAVATGALRLLDAGYEPIDITTDEITVHSKLGCADVTIGDYTTNGMEDIPFKVASNPDNKNKKPKVDARNFIKSLKNWEQRSVSNETTIANEFVDEISKNIREDVDGNWVLRRSLYSIFLSKIVRNHYL
ncbi:MAG: hypothetical protein ACUZ8O_07090 [Candidatus Anammoxibacter sp.]